MSRYPFLLLPGEIECLQQALSHRLGEEDRPAAVKLRQQMQGKLTQAAGRASYSRAETRRLAGRSRQTLAKRLVEVEADPSPVVSLRQAYQLAVMRLTMYAHDKPAPEGCLARLVELDEAEVYVIAAALADITRLRSDPRLAYLAEWFELVNQPQVILPVRAVVKRWANLAYSKKPELQEQFLRLNRRGLFYRTKIATGALRLTEADAAQRHLDTCHLWRSEVLVLGRNSWAIMQIEEVREPPLLARLLPAEEG